MDYARNKYRSSRFKKKGINKLAGLRIADAAIKMPGCLEYNNNLIFKNWDAIQWFYNILIDFKKYLRYLEGDNQLRIRKEGIKIKCDGIWKIFPIYNYLFI